MITLDIWLNDYFRETSKFQNNLKLRLKTEPVTVEHMQRYMSGFITRDAVCTTYTYVNKGQTYSYTVASAPATTKLGFDAGIQITVGTAYSTYVCSYY